MRCIIKTQSKYLKKGTKLKIVPQTPVSISEVLGYSCNSIMTIKILGTNESYVIPKNTKIIKGQLCVS